MAKAVTAPPEAEDLEDRMGNEVAEVTVRQKQGGSRQNPQCWSPWQFFKAVLVRWVGLGAWQSHTDFFSSLINGPINTQQPK